jgi:WD40 repeat protein
MGWPLSQDYNEAVQSPRTSFADPELRLGQAAANALGIPMPRSGNFADVYEFRCPGGARWAVKCFTREVPGLRDRYALISDHLRAARLPFTVDFHYLEQGLRINGRWYPVLKMQWVEGFTLNEFVRDNLDKPATLEALLQIWARMARRLREAKIAHADLQHGNVLLVPGSKAESLAVKLIDYDGMWLPALSDRKSGEVGHPAYQHPQRLREGTYSAEVDRFPLLVVAAALRCLKAGGRSLWDKYDTGDNLLFRQQDLEAPNKSALFYELLKRDDSAPRNLVERLIEASRKPLDQTPLLDEVRAEPETDFDVTPVRPVSSPSPSGVFPAGKTAPARTAVVTAEQSEASPWRAAVGDTDGFTRSTPMVHTKSRLWLWVIGGAAAAALLVVTAVTAVTLIRATPQSPKPDTSLALTTPEDIAKKPDKGTGTDPRPKDEGKQPDEPPKKPDETGSRNPPLADKPGKHWEETSFLHNKHELQSGVRRISLSPDGRRLLAVGEPSPVYLFDLDRPASPPLTLGTDRLFAVAFAPDGQKFFVAGTDKVIRLCKAENGEELQRFEGHLREVYHLAVFPDGNRLVSCGPDNAVFLWEVATGKLLARWDVGCVVHAVALNPSGNRVLIACDDGRVRLFDVANEKLICTFEGHAGRVRFVTFSPDGKYASTCGDDRTVRVWDVGSGEELRVLRGHGDTVWSVEFSPDGRRMLSSGGDQTIRLWETESGKLVHTYEFHKGRVSQVLFARGGQHAISGGGQDKSIVLLGLPRVPMLMEQPLVLKPTMPDGGKPPPATVKSPNDPPKKPGETPKMPAKPWEETLVASRALDPRLGVRDLALSRDSRWLSTVGQDTAVTVYDLNDPSSVAVLGKDEFRGPVAISPDGKKLFAAGKDQVIHSWELGTRKELKKLKGHKEEIEGLAAFPDGRRMLSCGADKAIFLWDVDTGERLDRWDDGETVHAVAVRASDSDFALSAGDGGRVRLWSTVTGKVLREFKGHTGAVRAVAFSPDGKYALTGGEDKTVRVWEVFTGRESRKFEGHSATVRGVDFAPDARRVLSAGEDGTVRLWDTDSGKQLEKYEFHAGPVFRAIFSSRGQHAVSCGDDRKVVLFPLPPAELVLDKSLELKPLAPVAQTPGATGTGKAPPPDSDARAKAYKQIRDVYKKEFATADAQAKTISQVKESLKREYAARAFDDQKEFANKLFKAGQAARDDKAERYVLLREVTQRAAELGLMSLAFRAVDELAKEFDVNARELKMKAVVTAGRSLLTLEGTVGLLEDVQPLYDEILKVNEFDNARELVAAQTSAVKALGYAPLVNAVQDRLKRADALKWENEKTRDAKSALAKNADDPKANRDFGRFLCLYKGDWDAGLRALAKGGDEPLCALARKDLAGAASADDQVALGEAWSEFTEVKGDLPRMNLHRRARHWFRQALPRLEGERKTKYESLVADADKAAAAGEKPITLFSFLEGNWVIQYSINTTREYTIQADGTVEGAQGDASGFRYSGKLSVSANYLLLDLTNKNKERFELVHLKGTDRLLVAHWANGAVFPQGKPTCTGEGVRKK